jgi:hypothetical protein
MAFSFSHAHDLGVDEARRRLVAESTNQDVAVSFDATDPNRGEVSATSPLGAVRARFVIGPREIAVEVFKKPAFVPEGMVRAEIERGLTKLLS